MGVWYEIKRSRQVVSALLLFHRVAGFLAKHRFHLPKRAEAVFALSFYACLHSFLFGPLPRKRAVDTSAGFRHLAYLVNGCEGRHL